MDEHNISELQKIEYLIRSISEEISNLGGKIKEYRTMIQDAYNGNEKYQSITEKIRNLKKEQKKLKDSLLQTNAVQKAQAQIKELALQKKTLEKKLSHYLQNYVEKTKSTTIEDRNGIVNKIITIYKMVRFKDK